MYRTVLMYCCPSGHRMTREFVPGRPPAPELPCQLCAKSRERAARFGKEVPPVRAMKFEGERRVKNSAMQLRG